MTVPVICGPTASGKNAVAMWLSLRREITIISADSRQIYRGFDIGTAKPSAEDQARVPHRGVDVAEPTERYSAAQWGSLARTAIHDAIAAGRQPVIVGGTGFYIGALFQPLWEQPSLDPDRREAVQRVLDAQSTDELRRWCAALDPDRAHLGRAQLLRAVEIALLTGERLSHLHVTRARPTEWRGSYLLVDPGMELPSRIVARASAMFDAGWPEEVRRLMDLVPEDAPAWHASGYDAVRDLVRVGGAITSTAALERVVIETRQYAKRQRTWFRHQLAREDVRRLAFGESGWQEKVDRWITEV
ncbi:MAG: tRNA (adenosine(37)-N6)-dimethylallyltransferase MiaA, partial [Gemmatimonadaceae bacterium]